jgi:hypothetical protein
MKNSFHLICATAASGLFLTAAAVQAQTVPATANIFSAGLSAPIAPAGGGAGTLPICLELTPGQTLNEIGMNLM